MTKVRIGVRAAAAVLTALLLVGLTPTGATEHETPDSPLTGQSVASPTLSIPPDGLRGHALWDSWFDLSEFGYEEQEYFVSGTASDIDGNSADYTTRIIVFRPSSDDDFNGTVILDWVNVTAQFENAVDSTHAHEMFFREGFAWVHVSAQSAGLSGAAVPLVPKNWDPVRYAAINHPGDEYSFNMVSQIAKAMKGGGTGEDPRGGLDVDYVLATGQSQSAGRLTDYVELHHDTDQIIDGFLIHGTFSHDGPDFSSAPVIHLESDADVQKEAEEGALPQDQRPNIVLWEVAGTAHSDFWIGYHSVVGSGPRSQSSAAKVSRSEKEAITLVASNYGEEIHPLLSACTLAGATMPMWAVTSAAFVQLDQWVKTGVAAPSAPRAEFSDTSTRANGLATDELGNALGGIRLAPIEHPVARYESASCELGGVTVPFSEPQIVAEYGDHQSYYEAFAATTAKNIADGFLLPADAQRLLDRACVARVRFGGLSNVDHCPTVAAPPPSPPAAVTPSTAAPAAAAPAATESLPATGGNHHVALLAGALAALALGLRGTVFACTKPPTS